MTREVNSDCVSGNATQSDGEETGSRSFVGLRLVISLESEKRMAEVADNSFYVGIDVGGTFTDCACWWIRMVTARLKRHSRRRGILPRES